MKYLLAIGLVVALIQPGRRADPEIHLIPSDFRGKVQIVFRAPNGVPARLENGAHVYDIPSDGLLLTQADSNEGLSPEYRFFFVTPEGEHKPISRIYTSSERLSGEVGIAFLRKGRFQAGQPAACDVPTYEYFVGNDADLKATDESTYYLRLWPIIRDHYVCP
jgi:hypothetical protein